jgi:hypothetical protein
MAEAERWDRRAAIELGARDAVLERRAWHYAVALRARTQQVTALRDRFLRRR